MMALLTKKKKKILKNKNKQNTHPQYNQKTEIPPNLKEKNQL